MRPLATIQTRLPIVLLLTGLLYSISSTSALAEETVRDEYAPPAARDDLSPEAEQVARLINQLRAAAGLPPLAVHPLLNRAATSHIASMVANGVYGHTGFDGSSAADRVARTGYVVDGWVGENWAVFATVVQAVDWWNGHPPHRANLLNRYYTEMGVGVWPHPAGRGLIVVVDFSTGQLGGDAITVKAEHVSAFHIVVPGDTLYGIGQTYEIRWQRIARENGLTAESILQVGQQLALPWSGEAEEGVAKELPQTLHGLEESKESISQTHMVQSGDSLWSIAARRGIALSDLMRQNGLTAESVLFPGQILQLPPR